MCLVLILILAFSSVTSASASLQEENQKRNTDANPESAEVVSQPGGVISSGGNNGQPQCPTCCTEIETSHQPRRDWVDPTAIFTAVLSLFTFGMAVVIYFQLRAVQLSERAWMIAQMEIPPDEYKTDQILRLACHIKNMGRTVAFLTAKGEQKEISDKSYSLPNPPLNYANTIRWPEKAFAFPPTADIVIFHYLFQDETKPVYNGDKVLWIHGFIEYADVFGHSHETRYCFRYHPGLGGKDSVTVGFYPDGPDAYNKAT